MKILKLRLKNIQSLRGLHLIDFTVKPLSESGLFAITGATGAGKSTILDIITLALFNQVPRFGENGISKSKLEENSSIVTHHQDEAFAEIDYEIAGQQYRSSWSIHRASKTKKMQDYEMTLATLPDGQYITDKKTEVPLKNAEIIGLNYTQFIRSILLSQGEFAKFIKSESKERALLLEQITGTQNYRVIGKKVFEYNKGLKEEVKDLQTQINLIPGLNQDDIDAKTLKIEENHKEILSLAKRKDILQNTSTKLKRQADLKSNINSATSELHVLEEKWVNNKSQVDRMTKHVALEPHLIKISEWKIEYIQSLEKNKDLNTEKIKLEKANANIVTAIADMSRFVGADVTIETFLPTMRDFQQRVQTLNTELSNIKVQGQDLKSQIDEQLIAFPLPSLETQIRSLTDANAQLDIIDKHLMDLQKESPFATITADNLSEALTQVEEELIELRSTLAQKKSLAQQQLNLQNNLKKKGDLESLKPIKLAQLKELEVSLSVIHGLLEKLSKQKDEAFKSANLDTLRAQLQDNEPCPLCGSLDHPYVEHKRIFEIGKIELEILTKTKEKNDIDKATQSLNHELATIDGELNNLVDQIKTLESSIAIASAEIPILYKEHKLDELDALIGEKNQLSTDLKVEEQRRKILREFELLRPKIEDRSQKLDLYHKKQNELNSIYKGNNVNLDADNIQNAFIAAQKDMESSKLRIEDLQTAIKGLEWAIDQKMNSLLPILQGLGYHKMEDALQDVLDENTKETIKAFIENYTQEKALILQKIDLHKSEYDQLTIEVASSPELTLVLAELQNNTLLSENLNKENGSLEQELRANTEFQAKKSSLQWQLDQKIVENLPWQRLDELIGDAEGNKYAKFAQNLSLKHLLQFANQRLVKLTDRYVLEITDINNDLRVLDLYQGGISRSVKTLSGGEAFIISLALALSLSDMASKNVKLESLFIDEGFGTLDNETLETAMETLERLQSESNRTIGIISHIDSLKERITTQIKVIKDAKGYSTIEIV